jgi:hypothetical protein
MYICRISNTSDSAGHLRSARRDPAGQHHQRKASFADLCTGCPLRERCTKAKKGRILTIRPHHDLLAAARHQAATDPDWQAAYRR